MVHQQRAERRNAKSGIKIIQDISNPGKISIHINYIRIFFTIESPLKHKV
jgi:hypothetical protein